MWETLVNFSMQISATEEFQPRCPLREQRCGPQTHPMGLARSEKAHFHPNELNYLKEIHKIDYRNNVEHSIKSSGMQSHEKHDVRWW